MTTNAELRFLVRHNRWALEELYVDVFTKRLNRYTWKSQQAKFSILRGVLGSRKRVLMAMYVYLDAAKIPYLRYAGTVNIQLKRVVKRFKWLLGEVLWDLAWDRLQRQMKRKLVSAQRMYSFIRKEYNKKEILESLRWLVSMQRQRRKSLIFSTEWRGR